MDQSLQLSQHTDLAISGMHCASCVARVEKMLRQVPGVRDAAVNLATETARVEAVGVPTEALVAAVGQAGYQAALKTAAPPPKTANRQEVLALLAGFALSLPLLAGMVWDLPGWLQFGLASIVQFWLGARFYRGGWASLRYGAPNMDALIALGSSAAYLLSVVDWARGAGPLYFEAAAVVITLVRLGKFLEGRAKKEAAAAINALSGLRPAQAHRLSPTAGDVPADWLNIGDAFEIRPGERVPADGEVVSGTGNLDEAPITGEALPVLKSAGDKVLAGTLNLDAVLRARVTASADESFLDRMARLIESAQASKPAVQKQADRLASVFVPAVLLAALATFLVWGLALHAPISVAVINAVSVLVIACPCALGLAVPAAILAGTGAAARRGILIRDADALERAAKVDLVVFDKTGTLTLGQPTMLDVKVLGDADRQAVLDIAASLAAADTHPLAAPLRRDGIAPAEALRILPGLGVEGRVGGLLYRLGSASLVAAAPATEAEGATLSFLAGEDGAVLAMFAFTDSIRPGATEAISRLRSQGCDVALLTGDRPEAANRVAAALGITQVTAAATPEGKLAALKAYREAGRVVAMVGDGVNDAPALAAADLGIAMGSGADVAIEAADVSLLRPDLALVAEALHLAGRTRAVLRQGLFWALVYNVIGIPLAACGLLNPMVAGAAMAASSVSVLANALRLRRAA